MKKILLSTILFLVFASYSFAETVPETISIRADLLYRIPYADANKKIDGSDNYLCFAAAASNMIYWSYGYDAQETFEYLKKFFENKPEGNTLRNAIKKYMVETEKEITGVEPKDELIETFLLEVLDYRFDPFNFKPFIFGSLLKGELVCIAFKTGHGTYHVFTVYGVTIYKDDINKITLTCADSDDKRTGLFDITFTFNGKDWVSDITEEIVEVSSIKSMRILVEDAGVGMRRKETRPQ